MHCMNVNLKAEPCVSGCDSFFSFVESLVTFDKRRPTLGGSVIKIGCLRVPRLICMGWIGRSVKAPDGRNPEVVGFASHSEERKFLFFY